VFQWDNIIDPYIERVKPHAQQLGSRLDAFAWMLLAKLDTIAENTGDDDQFVEARRRLQRSVTLAGGRVELDTVPMSETWILEVATATAGNLVIDDGTGFVMTTAAVDSGRGIVFPSGSKVAVLPSADATIFLQFKVHVPRPGKQATTGQVNPDAEGVGPFSPTGRHVSPDVGHVPIRPTGDAPMGAGQGT
jgi:hypothetical protein